MKKLLPFLLSILLACNLLAQKPSNFEGLWLKYTISESGVYKIPINDLRSKITNFNQDKITILTSLASQLPQNNAIIKDEFLEKIPYKIIENHIYFYIEGPSKLSLTNKGIEFKTSIYDKNNYVFIGITNNPSEIIKNAANTEKEEVKELNYYFSLKHLENDKRNFLASGRVWAGDFFNEELNLNLNSENRLDSILYLTTQIIGQTTKNEEVNMSINGVNGKTHHIHSTNYSSSDPFLRYNRLANFSFLSDTLDVIGENLNLNFKFKDRINNPYGAYIDFVEYYYRKNPVFSSNQEQLFLFPDSITKKIKFTGLNTGHLLWEISSKTIKEINFNSNSEALLSPLQNVKWQLFNPKSTKIPELKEEITDEIISSSEIPDLLIVYPKDFKEAATKLKTLRENDGLTVQSIEITSIYNSFSGGKVDVSALRNYCKYLWEQNPEKFKYLVLIGDASFDYKNNLNYSFVEIENQIPTYQSYESFEPVFTYSSDDYFGFLENHEGDWPEGQSINGNWVRSTSEDHSLDIAIGRIPAKTEEEALAFVEKLKIYSESKGKWKANIGFVADNGDFNIHQRYVEEFSSLLAKNDSPLFVKKLFIDNYSSPTLTNLKAKEALTDLVEEGTLILNYNGHGSEVGWAQEKLLTLDQIEDWNNINKLPIFFIATCEFGKFDNPSIVSGAEIALLSLNGGASALLTTTRPVYSSTNKEINLAFYNSLSNLLSQSKIRIGDLFKETKNNAIINESNRNFTLLGDPSMILNLPIKNKINIESINNGTLEDTQIKALDKVVIKGSISDSEFNGALQISIYDKPISLKTLGQGTGSSVMEYESKEIKIFEGATTITNGKFDFSFIVPKDINYKDGFGSIYLYAAEENSLKEAINLNTKIKIGGLNTNAFNDTDGPEIKATIKNNILEASIFDLSGINLSNYGIGHTPLLIINDTLNLDITEYYNAIDSYSNGKIILDLGFLPKGKHTVQLKLFDTYNNRSILTLNFQILETEDLFTNFKIYPNPVSTLINFEGTLDKEMKDINYNLKIYDLNGQIQGQIDKNCIQCVKKINFSLPLHLILKKSGIYYYKLEVVSKEQGVKRFKTGRILFSPI